MQPSLSISPSHHLLPLSEPSRSQGGPDGRSHAGESEPSDDEMLSLSSQQSSTSTATQKPEPPAAGPAAAEPPEEVDLLGLDGADISRPSAQPSSATATTTTDLLGDLFGGPPEPSSVPSSAQSTPHKVAPSTASPCPSPAPGSKHNGVKAKFKSHKPNLTHLSSLEFLNT